MVQFLIRSSKTDIGTLAVRIVNRPAKINTIISIHLKMKIKDWVEATQLPKNPYDVRPVSELGMSYADLTAKLQKMKKVFLAMEDVNMTVDAAKKAIRVILNEELIEEAAQAATDPVPAKPTFTEYIAQYIHECETGERLKQKSTKKIKDSSLKSYRGMLAQVKAYQDARKCIIDWDDINFDFYDDFKRFMIEKNYSPNTIARNIKSMKTILYAAKILHYTTRDDFTSKKWSADKEEVDNIYIPISRLREMAMFDLSDYRTMKELAIKYAKNEEEEKKLTHALRRDIYRRRLAEARDIFVMGCITGQRVSDYKRISLDMVETIKGDRNFLHLVQTKTGKDVYVPYDDLMETILKRYDGKLPKVYDQDLNERIKVVGLLLGWVEPAGIQEHRGLLQYQSKKRFCDAIMTHTARRSFATNAYRAGVPLSAIMAVTGHSSEEMLKRYLKLGSKEKALLAADEFDKVNFAI